MSKTTHRSKQFKKDYQRAKKRGKDIAKLEAVLEKIMTGQPLEKRHKQHALKGDWQPALECHIEGDWILIWESVDPDHIRLLRTGRHKDIFKEECEGFPNPEKPGYRAGLFYVPDLPRFRRCLTARFRWVLGGGAGWGGVCSPAFSNSSNVKSLLVGITVSTPRR